ncbi:MAG: transcription antitermination factor NusB [Acidobacteriota bacterium]
MRPDRGSVRSCAAWAIDRTLDSRASADRYLGEVATHFDLVDRKLLYQLALGTLRWLRRLDHVIAKASSRSPGQIDPLLRAPLRLATYEMLFLDRVPTYASVNEAVEEATRRRQSRGGSFVNAVLRRISQRPQLTRWPVSERDVIRKLGIETSHPDFLVERWMRQFGEQETRRLLDVNNRPKPVHLLTFEDRGNGPPAARDLLALKVSTRPSKLSPLGLIVEEGDPFSTAVFHRGDLYGQDEVSQSAALIPPPRLGERVLDLAAAPGGKTFSLLASEPSLVPFASELQLSRLLVLRANASRLGRKIPTVVADGARPPYRGGFDRVVVDLPCSGTGTLRKHPELKWRIDGKELYRLQTQGRRIVEGAAQLPRDGGLLVIITCSLEEEESVGVVESLVQKHKELELVNLQQESLGRSSEFIVGRGFWRVLPAEDHDGATVHVLRRRDR